MRSLRMQKLAGIRKVGEDAFEKTRAVWSPFNGEISVINEELINTDFIWGGGGEMDDVLDSEKKSLTDFITNQIYNGLLTLDNLYGKVVEAFNKSGQTTVPTKSFGGSISGGTDVYSFYAKYEPIQTRWVALVKDQKLPLRPGESGGAAATSSGKGNSIIFNDSIFKLKVSINKEVDGRIVSESSVEVISGDMYNFDPEKDISLMLVDSKMGDKRYKPNSFNANNTYYISTLFGIKSSGGAKKEDSGKRKSSGGGGGQTTGNVVQLTGNPGDIKVETLANGETFTYTIKSPTEFSYIWKDKDGKEKKKNDSVTTTYPKWSQTATAINALPVTTPAQTAPAAPTAPATEAAPAGQTTGGETAPAEGRSSASYDPQLVSNVGVILQNASTRAYAMTVPGNQKKQIREMLRAAGVAATSAGITGVTNPSDFLAKLLITKMGAGSLSSIGAIQGISNMTEKEIKGSAKEEVRRLMFAVNELYKQYGEGDYTRMVRQFASVMRRGRAAAQGQSQATSTPAATGTPAPAAAATPPATPAPAAGSAPASATAPATGTPAAKKEVGEPADDGTTKKSSRIDPRIKKLATLRRLRVRSQMEAAVESSAQLGRFRIS